MRTASITSKACSASWLGIICALVLFSAKLTDHHERNSSRAIAMVRPEASLSIENKKAAPPSAELPFNNLGQ